MSVNKITAVLLVEEVEPCVEFWEKLGFQKTIEVPEGNKISLRDPHERQHRTDVPNLRQRPEG